MSNFSLFRVRFLLGGRHGDFKFLPPSSYAPCYEALLPKEKMKVEPVKEYKRDVDGVRDLLGTTQFMSQASFIPTPVETSQVSSQEECRMAIMRKTPPFSQRLWCNVTCKSIKNANQLKKCSPWIWCILWICLIFPKELHYFVSTTDFFAFYSLHNFLENAHLLTCSFRLSCRLIWRRFGTSWLRISMSSGAWIRLSLAGLMAR